MAKVILNGEVVEMGSGGSDITFDDTMTESNGVYSVTRPVHPILTQAEYDALPEAEKNNGVYVVSDGEDVSEESGSTGPGEVYSEEETRIGTWIDGKPLYRKVVNGNLSSTNNSTSTISTIPNADDVVTIHGYAVYSDPSRITSIPTGFDKGTTIQLSAYKTVDGARIEAFNSTSSLVGRPCTIIVEYTKTTD